MDGTGGNTRKYDLFEWNRQSQEGNEVDQSSRPIKRQCTEEQEARQGEKKLTSHPQSFPCDLLNEIFQDTDTDQKQMSYLQNSPSHGSTARPQGDPSLLPQQPGGPLEETWWNLPPSGLEQVPSIPETSPSQQTNVALNPALLQSLMVQQILNQNPQAALSLGFPLQAFQGLNTAQPMNQTNVVSVTPQFAQQDVLGGSHNPSASANPFAVNALNQTSSANTLSSNVYLGSIIINTAAAASMLGLSTTGQQQQQQQQEAQSAATGASGRQSLCLYLLCDDESLSAYQCLVRKQIEIFEASREDVDSNAQGRNRPIALGQVGIRCKHCSMVPPKSRARGAIYYPAKLSSLYQAAQNMASVHLCQHCPQLPKQIREELLTLRQHKSSAGGGKKYWADGVRVLGVVEDGDILRFASSC